MTIEQTQMVSSWIVLAAILASMVVFWESSAATYTIPAIAAAIFYLVRGDLPKMQHLRIHEMSKLLQYYAVGHYFAFAIIALYLAIYRSKLVTYDATQFILTLFALMFPLALTAIKTEVELFRSYGRNNA
jgi:hypothetical protein